ncbi:MAG TPA: two-component regulator propeller domain-containing protein [Methylomirabilota bacterium]|nr:two-component regulator propeller domain-containing protein [Methylomirabilota bacterium]
MRKNFRTLRFALPLLCVLAFVFSANAQKAGGSASSFIVDSWSNEEGLPQSSVISVVQTRDGYLWLGTLNGLVRFDGNQFTVFNQMNTPGLSSDRIVFLFEDNEANLWAGTDSGGLLTIKNGVVKNFGTPADGGKIIYAREQTAGDILFTTPAGIVNYHNGKMNFLPGVTAPLLSNLIVPSKAGGVWQVFNGTVQKWGNNRLKKDFGISPWGSTVVTAALEDEKTNLIVGTLGAGIFWLDADGKWQNISTEQGLSSVYVLSLCMDSEKNLWAGTDGGGLNRIKRKIFNSPVGFPSRGAQSLSEDNHGGWWIASGALGVSYWNTNSLQDFQVGPLHDAWEVLVDRRQQIQVGTLDEGLYQFQTNQFVPSRGAQILGPQIFALFEGRDGQLWTGTQRGLGNFDGQKWKLFTTRDGLSENSVRALAQDTNGTLWIGTENHGLNFFKDGKISAVQGNLAGNDISCLYADNDGALWVGTFGHGLARFKNGDWKSFSKGDGLASDSISYIFEDDGYLWIGSNAGLMRVQKKSLEDFADGTGKSISCRTFGKADGLPTRECSIGSQPSACRTGDGRLWFPTVKGVATLNPAELKQNLQPPAVLIESVLVDGRQQKTNPLAAEWSHSVTVAPGGDQSKVQLEIHYTALDFSAPTLVRFKYQLEGFQTDWTDAGNERIARYPKLPPGKYHFNVIALNEDGVPNKDSRLLEVIVLPQFWQTTWFRIAAIAFVLAFIIAAVRIISTEKLQRELQRHKQQEALERERARIARDLHDQLGANLTQVALLGEMAEADKFVPEEIESHAKQISETARETTHSLDEIVWAINPSNDTLESLVNYACKYAQEYLALAGVRYRASVPAQLPPTPIPPEVRHNVFLAFKEAVHNVVKHAQATEVCIRLHLHADIFILEIADNGKGISDLSAKQNRSGLRNMKKRMEDIGGNFSFGPAEDGGTIVRLIVPIS